MPSDSDTADRRSQILAAAAKVFNARGYAGATIDEVATETGIAKGSVYNYFKSKQDLFVQVFTASFAQDEEALVDHLVQPDSALAKIDKVLDKWYGHFGKYTREGALVLEFWLSAARQGEGFLTESLRDLYLRWRQRISAIMAEGLANGEMRPGLDPESAAIVVMATLDGVILQSILGVGLVVDAEFLRRLKHSFRGALAASLPAEPTEEEA